MPLLIIETNKTLEVKDVDILIQKASKHISELLNKPEKWIMVSFVQSPSMIFDGTHSPCAFLTLKSIGLEMDKVPDLSASLCEFIEKQIKIARERIYIEFQKLEGAEFGWNGSVF